ncbi:hypothetical protein LTR22_016012 [Elasticomyces elasticus]|nr:hypothetical protein LTR22_016012 [Elasticomyces elasticus]
MDKAKSAMGMSSDSTTTVAGHPIHKIGYGLMGLTWRASPPSQSQAFATMKAALTAGSNFWNGGEIYGNADRNSLHLLQEYFTAYPSDVNKVLISIKGGSVFNGVKPDGSAENTRRSIQECIDVLGKAGKKLDIWESARVDPETPIEITMRAAKDKVTKIEAVEVELSLWETTIFDNGVASTCAELGIPIVAYAPLSRGFLTGQIRSYEDLPEDDMRRHLPRFSKENFGQNIKLVEELEKIAEKKGCTPGQVGVSWILAKSGSQGMPTFIPIPGSTTEERVKENMVWVELSENDVKEIDGLLESVEISGDRYAANMNGLVFGLFYDD